MANYKVNYSEEDIKSYYLNKLLNIYLKENKQSLMAKLELLIQSEL